MKLIALSLGCLILLSLAAALIIFIVTFKRSVLHEPQNTPARPKWRDEILAGRQWFEAQGYETLTLESHDGLRLSARYLPAGSDKTVILMHGYHTYGLYELAPQLSFYYGLGYNLLLPDGRAHGGSEGKYLTLGILEKEDIRGWAELMERTYRPSSIFLVGASMGAATVLSAATLPLPKSVKGVIADCPFADPVRQFAYSLSHKAHLPGKPFVYLCGIFSRLLAGFHFTDFSETDLITARLPLLVLHGLGDTVVPEELSETIPELYGGSCQRITFENCPHVYAFIQEKERYTAAVVNFLQKYGKEF